MKHRLVEGGIYIDDGYETFLDLRVIGQHNDLEEREHRAQRALELLEETGLDNVKSNNGLRVSYGSQRVGYGVFQMKALLPWPLMSDDEASIIATTAMQKTAIDINAFPDMSIDEMVYASLSKKTGVTLQTNPIAASSMDTDGDSSSLKELHSSGIAELWSHNLYSRDAQLICIAGLLSLAAKR